MDKLFRALTIFSVCAAKHIAYSALIIDQFVFISMTSQRHSMQHLPTESIKLWFTKMLFALCALQHYGRLRESRIFCLNGRTWGNYGRLLPVNQTVRIEKRTYIAETYFIQVLGVAGVVTGVCVISCWWSFCDNVLIWLCIRKMRVMHIIGLWKYIVYLFVILFELTKLIYNNSSATEISKTW